MNTSRQRTLVARMALTIMLVAGGGIGSAMAQVAPPPASRTPQPYPASSAWTQTTSSDGMTTTISTPTSHFPSSDPSINPTNLLPTVYANVKNAAGVSIANTLPSTPANPYNLMAGPPATAPINATSPADMLEAIYAGWKYQDPMALRQACQGTGIGDGGSAGGDSGAHGVEDDNYTCEYDPANFNPAALQTGIDILEGNPVPNVVWSGIPMLHIAAPDEVRKVQIQYDASGNPIGGNVTVHYYYFDQHVEEDTAFIDPSAMLQPAYQALPWTITYVVDILDRGAEDFSPMEALTTDPAVYGSTVPLVLFDPTFYPTTTDGTRYTFVIKQPPAVYWSLVYDWGWRQHPGRITVMENALKTADGQTLPQWESNTFGADPMANATSKLAAIAMISDLAPAKRMWLDLQTLQQSGYNAQVMQDYEQTYHHWQERNQLPAGVTPDPNAEETLFYGNDTIYGQLKDFPLERDDVKPRLLDWNLRGYNLTIKVINGDYFPHAYFALDFGGLRGWENLYQNAVALGGNGAWFTFGRAYWSTVPAAPVIIPAAVPGNLAADIHDTTARALAASRMLASSKVPGAGASTLSNAALAKSQPFNIAAMDPAGSSWPKLMPMPTLLAQNGDVLGVHSIGITLNYEPSLRMRIYQFDPLHHMQAIWTVH